MTVLLVLLILRFKYSNKGITSFTWVLLSTLITACLAALSGLRRLFIIAIGDLIGNLIGDLIGKRIKEYVA